MSAYTPSELSGAYLRGDLGLFDAVVTYSSVEHSGLGRYGDAFNPWGDLIFMARAWCLLKPGGMMLVGVPTGNPERVFYNAHRCFAWGLCSCRKQA